MVQSSSRSFATRENANLVSSGDHVGVKCLELSETSSLVDEPSAVTEIQMSVAVLNRNFVPLGDHSGWTPYTSGTSESPVDVIETMRSSDVPGSNALLTNRIRLACGCHAASKSNETLLVMFVCPEPSAFMTKMSSFPIRVLENAIWLPSDDHVGFRLDPADIVSCLSSVPSEFTTKISPLPSTVVSPLVNAMVRPDGEIAGQDFTPSIVVSWLMTVPSPFITWICELPLRSETKTIEFVRAGETGPLEESLQLADANTSAKTGIARATASTTRMRMLSEGCTPRTRSLCSSRTW
jgi:hypothetical protein